MFVEAKGNNERGRHFFPTPCNSRAPALFKLKFMPIPRASLGFLLALALPASAQNAALPRVSGTLSQTQNGQTVKANVFWQAPDSLKIEVLGAKNEVAQVVLASGDSTLSFDSATKRLHVLNANIAREWFRGWNISLGGPANFAFTGATGFEATPNQGVMLARDKTLLGQDGERAFYIAWKRRVRSLPEKIVIENGVRSDYDPFFAHTRVRQAPTLQTRAQIVFDAQKLPTHAEVEARGEKFSFDYNLQPRADDFPAGTFALPDAAKDAVREAQELAAPSAYKGETADDLCNRGEALWNASGDAAGALDLLARASALNPRATAPKLWAFDVALSTRQPDVAARALESLKGDLSDTDFAALRSRLDVLSGDGKAELEDLRLASSTGDAARLLAYSLAQKARGDVQGARATWNALLAPDVPRDIQALAGENLAIAATREELPTLGATLSGDADAVRLARALLDLRSGKTADGTTFAQPEFAASYARALERANNDEAAKVVWTALEAGGSPISRNDARAHLMTLAARAGDAPVAFAHWNRWNASIESQTERDAAQEALFDAFQKAGRVDILRAAIANRSTAIGARDNDLRLQLAFQEAFGTDPLSARALDAGFERFPNVPFWEGKKAERLVETAFSTSGLDDFAARNRNATFQQAIDLLDKAIKIAPEPSYWVQQRALLLVQRGTKGVGGEDANQSKQEEDAARAALEALEKSADPDFQTVAALGWNFFPQRDDKARAVTAAARALDSAPFDGDRATLIFANRQVLARVLAPAQAAAQWNALFDITRSANDEAGLVAALLNELEKSKDGAGTAQLLLRVAGERWPLDDYSFLLNGAAGRIAGSPLLPDVLKSLDVYLRADMPAGNIYSYLLARAALSAARLARANVIIAQPGAPPVADAELLRATRAQVAAFAALQTLAGGNTPFWSSRARSLLLDSASVPADAKRALLEKSVASEPGEPSIALALANAQTDPKARAQTATTLEFSPETWRRLALDALAGGDRDGALFWSAEAFNFATHSPDVTVVEFQRIAFARAKIAWQTGSPAVASAIYSQLSSAGWADADRAAALLALRRRFQESKQNDEALALAPQIKAIGLDENEASNAIGFLDEVEN